MHRKGDNEEKPHYISYIDLGLDRICPTLIEMVQRGEIESVSVDMLLHIDINHCWFVFNPVDDKRTADYHGLFELTPSLLLHMYNRRVVVVDVSRRKTLFVKGIDLSEVRHNEIADLNVNGDRWEGDVVNGKPCGWGVFYDRDNHMTYEGFRIDGTNVCYGRSFFGDVGGVEYEGEWCEGKRWWRGTQYDRKGRVLFDGKWLDDYSLIDNVGMIVDDSWAYNRIERLFVSENSCNQLEGGMLDLSFLTELKELVVGNRSFFFVEEVRLIGLERIESIRIGDECFMQPEGRFYLKNCPSLKELYTFGQSFNPYFVCEIEDMEALETIRIGNQEKTTNNFVFASLVLKSV